MILNKTLFHCRQEKVPQHFSKQLNAQHRKKQRITAQCSCTLGCGTRYSRSHFKQPQIIRVVDTSFAFNQVCSFEMSELGENKATNDVIVTMGMRPEPPEWQSSILPLYTTVCLSKSPHPIQKLSAPWLSCSWKIQARVQPLIWLGKYKCWYTGWLISTLQEHTVGSLSISFR